MKLLFDQNLSPKLVSLLADLFAGSAHVRSLGFERADDATIWKYAKDHGYTIVSKDSDFQERSQLARSSPRVVWIRRGNCSTSDIEAILRRHAARIHALEQQTDDGFVVLL